MVMIVSPSYSPRDNLRIMYQQNAISAAMQLVKMAGEGLCLVHLEVGSRYPIGLISVSGLVSCEPSHSDA